MAEHDLWVTDRCAREDLGLDSWPDPEGVRGVDNESVRKFRERRRDEAEPTGAYINDIKGRPCYKLKDGRLRGATWFDRDMGVVYLLAVKYREAASKDDAYEEFLALERTGRLFPTVQDEEEVQAWRSGRWLRELRDEVGPELLRIARSDPGVPLELDLGQCEVVIVADRYDGGYLVQLRIERQRDQPPLGDRQIAAIIRALLGDPEMLDETRTWYAQPIPWDCRAFVALYAT